VARSVRDGSRRDTALFALCVILAIVARALPEPVRDPIAAALRQTIVAPLLSLQGSAERTRSAWLNYEGLTVSRDSIALRAMQVQTLETENDRLRQLLALGSRLGWGFIPAEALHGQSIGEETTVSLSAGSDAGVRRYAPVVAPEGLVGMIQSVDPGMSVALLWGHPQFRPSAMSADGSAFGIIYPHASEGAERFLLELRGVQFRSALDTGSLVVTSGLGGVFPAGIPIGTVLGEIKTTELWARTYLLRPAVPPPDVRSVMILNQQRRTAGVQRVWSDTRADSAARAIARAGDSVVRKDAAIAAAAAAARTTPVAAEAAGTQPTPAPAPGRSGATQPVAGRASGAAPGAGTPIRRPAPARTDSTASPPVATPPVARPDSVVQSPPPVTIPVVPPPNPTPPPVNPPVSPPPASIAIGR
jgi:rod shape-determining protein MreC